MAYDGHWQVFASWAIFCSADGQCPTAAGKRGYREVFILWASGHLHGHIPPIDPVSTILSYETGADTFLLLYHADFPM
jgi:hypothetical protein